MNFIFQNKLLWINCLISFVMTMHWNERSIVRLVRTALAILWVLSFMKVQSKFYALCSSCVINFMLCISRTCLISFETLCHTCASWKWLRQLGIHHEQMSLCPKRKEKKNCYTFRLSFEIALVDFIDNFLQILAPPHLFFSKHSIFLLLASWNNQSHIAH